MSRQFNYFAMERDEQVVCEMLFKVFGELCILPERAPAELMVPRRVLKPEDLLSLQVGHYIVLVPPELAESVHFREVPGNKYVVDLRDSLVLEYSPSSLLTPVTVKAGRIAYFYKGDSEMDAKVTKLFWIFEQAAEEAQMLSQWVGNPKPNPLIVGE